MEHSSGNAAHTLLDGQLVEFTFRDKGIMIKRQGSNPPVLLSYADAIAQAEGQMMFKI